MTKFRASLLVLTGGISYGFLSGLTKLAYAAGVQTGMLSTWLNVVGSVVLWSIVLGLRRKTAPGSDGASAISRTEVLLLLFAGSLSGLTGILYYFALAWLPAALAIVLLFQFTWLGSLPELLLEGSRLTKARLSGLACLIPGTILAVSGGRFTQTGLAWWGIVLGLFSAVTYSGFLYCTGRVASQSNPWVRSALIVSGALGINLIIFGPGYLWRIAGGTGPGTAEVALSASRLAPLLIYGSLMGLCGPIIPTVCFTYGIPRTGSGLAALLGAVELPVVVLVAWLFLGEAVTALEWLGIAVIFLGIWLGERET